MTIFSLVVLVDEVDKGDKEEVVANIEVMAECVKELVDVQE